MKKGYTMLSFSGRISGYPASRISGKRNRISGRIPDIQKGRISGRPDIRCNPTLKVVLAAALGTGVVVGATGLVLYQSLNQETNAVVYFFRSCLYVNVKCYDFALTLDELVAWVISHHLHARLSILLFTAGRFTQT